MEYYCFNVGSSYSPIVEERECPSLGKSQLVSHTKQCQLGWCCISAKKHVCLGRENSNLGKQDLGIMSCGKTGWRQLFWKVRAELRKMVATRPTQGFKYDALSYSLNFDDGSWQDSDGHYRSPCCGCDHDNDDPNADPLEPSKPCS